MAPEVERRFVHASDVVFHAAEVGPPTAPAVLLLHQRPRSWDEFAGVLPLVAARCRAVALDLPGFGESSPLKGPVSIEAHAVAVEAFLGAAGIGRAAVVGHHFGGAVALELAASHPQRVGRLVLSSTPFCDRSFRAERADRPSLDFVEEKDDGSHLAELWQRRRPYYPPGRHDLLTRFVRDAVRAGAHVEAAHRAVSSYEMEARIGLVQAPTLLIRAKNDPFARPWLEPLAERLPGSEVVELDGGIALPEERPAEYAEAIIDFLGR